MNIFIGRFPLVALGRIFPFSPLGLFRMLSLTKFSLIPTLMVLHIFVQIWDNGLSDPDIQKPLIFLHTQSLRYSVKEKIGKLKRFEKVARLIDSLLSSILHEMLKIWTLAFHKASKIFLIFCFTLWKATFLWNYSEEVLECILNMSGELGWPMLWWSKILIHNILVFSWKSSYNGTKFNINESRKEG